MTKLPKIENFRSVTGFNDYHDNQTSVRLQVIQTLNQIASTMQLKFITLPHVEFQTTFNKSLGKQSTIVQKEFFQVKRLTTENDDSADVMVLRPELSSGMIRYLVKNKQIDPEISQGYVTSGNCFRYERPQKGRFREFFQWNYEHITFQINYFSQTVNLLRLILKKFKLFDVVTMEVNYLTPNQLTNLSTWFENHSDISQKLCQLCQNRLKNKNFFRILDCQICTQFFDQTLDLTKFLTSEEQEKYQTFLNILEEFAPEIKVVKNPQLTRGLDYYQGFVFEIKGNSQAWAQNTLIAGGVYQLQKFDSSFDPNLFGIGFAIGLERLILWLETNQEDSLSFRGKAKKILLARSQKRGPLTLFQDQKLFLVQQKLHEINVDPKVYFSKKTLKKTLEWAIQKRFDYLIWVGEENLKKDSVLIREINHQKSDKILDKWVKLEDIPNFLLKIFNEFTKSTLQPEVFCQLKDLSEYENQTVTVTGWLIRKVLPSKEVLFWWLRNGIDRCQLVFKKNHPQWTMVRTLSKESVVQASGIVRRKAEPINKHHESAKTPLYELEVNTINVINHAKNLPFNLSATILPEEQLRLRYRYLDFRNQLMQERMWFRFQLLQTIRNFFANQKTILEIETPILASPTIEGAQNFLVQMTSKPKYFFALPQSPQLYKQLLMTGGFSGYYQIARCFRDEKPRHDRQPEFSQLDCELPFVTRDQIMTLLEQLMIDLWTKHQNYWPKFSVPKKFVRMSYAQAMQEYGCDKPDLRFGLKLQNYSQLLTQDSDSSNVFQGLEFFQTLSQSSWHKITQAIQKITNHPLKYYFYDQTEELLTNLSPTDQEKLKLEPTVKGWVGFDGELSLVRTVLSQVRTWLGQELALTKNQAPTFCWVIDHPMVEYSKRAQKYLALHHPFCQPKIPETFIDHWQDAVATSFDLVINGVEIASGSERIYQRSLQTKVFEILGLSKDVMNQEFGYFLEAMDHGFPNHAGFGLGIERLLMVLCQEPNIRNVIAFPKTSKFTSLLTKTPKKLGKIG